LVNEVYKSVRSDFDHLEEVHRLKEEFPFLKTIAEKEENIRQRKKLLGINIE
jgi:hypothetical protein